MKLLGFDLDGTLLDSEKRVSAYTKNIIAAASEKGCMIVPVTGRPISGVPREVFLLSGVRYVVASNGAAVYEVHPEETRYILHNNPQTHGNNPACKKISESIQNENQKEEAVSDKDLASDKLGIHDIFPAKHEYSCIAGRRISKETAESFFAGVKALHEPVIFEVFVDGRGLVEENDLKKLITKFNKTPIGPYIHVSRKQVINLPEVISQLETEIDEISVMINSSETRAAILDILSDYPELTYVNIGRYDIEIVQRSAGKWNALAYVASLCGVEQKDIVTFGDGHNDISMLTGAGLGFAMKNAEPEVLQAVRKAGGRVTEYGNEEDGVAREVERLIIQPSQTPML